MKKNLSVFNYAEYPFILEFIEANLKGKCLDVGCFKGGVMALVKNGNVVGIDIDQWALRENILKQKVVVANAENIPFSKETFDTVFCGFVLSYVNEKERALNEIRRVLKKNGKAIFVLHHPQGTIKRINSEFAEKYKKNAVFFSELKSPNNFNKIKENAFTNQYYKLYSHKFKKNHSMEDFLSKLFAQYSFSRNFREILFLDLNGATDFFSQNGFSVDVCLNVVIPKECGHLFESVLISRVIERKFLLLVLKKGGFKARLHRKVLMKKSLSRKEYKIEAFAQDLHTY